MLEMFMGVPFTQNRIKNNFYKKELHALCDLPLEEANMRLGKHRCGTREGEGEAREEDAIQIQSLAQNRGRHHHLLEVEATSLGMVAVLQADLAEVK